MQLVLTLEIPGVTTSPMGMVPMGASTSTSTSSGICKQAATPEKPHGRVGSCMSTNACVGREGLGSVGVLSGEVGGLYRYQRGHLTGSYFWPRGPGWLGDLPGSHHWLEWVVAPSPIPKTVGALSSRGGSGMQGALGSSAAERVFRLSFSSFSGRATPWKTSLSVKDRYHFTSSLSSNTPFANNCGSPLAGRLFCSTNAEGP